MTAELPDHVRHAVLERFRDHHAAVSGLAVDSYTVLGEPGNYRVKLSYLWAGRTLLIEYRYMPPPGEKSPAIVRQILKYHGDEECWGAFCADCGW